jgi:acetyl-CoA C-acetyltransferase
MGNVLQAGFGQNPARQGALGANLSTAVPAMTVNEVYGSGLKTVALAAQAIRLGDADCMVAGGMENVSRAPYLMDSGRCGYRVGHGQLVVVIIRDGLWCAFTDCHMGITAENVAKEWEVSWADQDGFAVASQRVARRKQTVLVDTDEHPRPATTRTSCRACALPSQGTVSVRAGNASGINDGAAAMVAMSASRAKAQALTPLARIRRSGAGRPCGQGQRQRRRHCAGPSDRCQRDTHSHHAPVRDGAPRRGVGHCGYVHRRWPGHRHGGRPHLAPPRAADQRGVPASLA